MSTNKTIENVYQAGKNEKPPSSIDDFILAQAQESCEISSHKKQSTLKKSKKPRWFLPLSTAAIVVLSFSIILTMQHENKVDFSQTEMIQRSTETNESGFLLQKEQTNKKANPRADTNPTPMEEEAPSKPAAMIIDRMVNNRAEAPQNAQQKQFNKPLTEPVFQANSEKQKAEAIGTIADNTHALELRRNKKPLKLVRKSPKKKEKLADQETALTPEAEATDTSQQEADIQQLILLIKQGDNRKAMELITQLKIKYPDYDFSPFID